MPACQSEVHSGSYKNRVAHCFGKNTGDKEISAYFSERASWDKRVQLKMGLGASKYSDNDFEMVIRASKDLESMLEEFGATGKGLHEKISSGVDTGHITQKLAKSMRYLATLRNRLVHEKGFDCIPDRSSFIRTFEASQKELLEIADELRGNTTKKTMCVIC